MKRIFEIEYPDDCGEMWMNTDNLLLCLNAYCDGVKFKVIDCTEIVDELCKFTTDLASAVNELAGKQIDGN